MSDLTEEKVRKIVREEIEKVLNAESKEDLGDNGEGYSIMGKIDDLYNEVYVIKEYIDNNIVKRN